MSPIYVSQRVDSADEAEVIIAITKDSFKLIVPNVQSPAGEQSFLFQPGLIESWPDIMNIVRDQLGYLKLFWATEVMNNRDGLAAQCSRKRVPNLMERHLVSVALCPDKSWTAYVNQKAFIVMEDGAQGDVVETGWYHAISIFEEYAPSILPFVRHNRAKQKALGRLRQHDAVNALELQVDLLCEIVNTFVTGAPIPEWWPTLYTQIQANKAHSIYPTSISECIGFITQEKSYTRQIQRDYFAEMAEING